MAETEQNEYFGNGLRAYLERLSGAIAPAQDPAPQQPQSPSTPPPAPAAGPAPTAEERERALLDRERRFEEHVRGFEAHARAVAQREEQLRAQEERLREREQAAEQRTAAAAERRAVRDVLREHAELSVTRIVQVFDDALAATGPNGLPDHSVRLAAVRALLGEAYASTDDTAQTSAAIDELAALRERRVVDAPGL